ncbi:MAG: DUF4476 domain-containing protein, partial [Bacteroidia bacterium]
TKLALSGKNGIQTTYYYHEAQVKTIALLFGGDSLRLEFCKTAYPRTTDQVNYYGVYDAFRVFYY